jgi:tetratricopeptide (TPR) repeat protein
MPPGTGAARFIPSVVVFLVFASVFIATYLRQNRKRVAIAALMAPYRKGDFKAALQATEGLRKDARAYCSFRGGILTQLGDLKEAEELLQKSIHLSEQRELALQARGIRARKSLARQLRLTALSKSKLGELYLERGRYGEAIRCFEASLRDWPRRGSGHRAIAEAWLRRGDDPTEALKWAKLAVEEDRASKDLTQEVRDTNLGEDLGTLAWAVAVGSRDTAQVDRLVGEAESKVGTRLVSSCAQVQYFAGLAYAALGDTERSTQHFKMASCIDSQGRWGRAARAAARG